MAIRTVLWGKKFNWIYILTNKELVLNLYNAQNVEMKTNIASSDLVHFNPEDAYKWEIHVKRE